MKSNNLAKKVWLLIPVVGFLAVAGTLAYSYRERLAWHCDRLALRLVAMPDRQDFQDDSSFIEACVEFHIAKWFLANPKRDPQLFENRHPMTGEKIPVVRNGDRWVTYRGPGLISGPYIEVIVDDSGALVAINEMYAEL
ncbi:MAG: hypothetical protein KJ060_16030 [Candidatus Hydrogenedentes bacterium]|nr:hypothetical protein [Candidatus Hydrogenedentota bacterium]